MNGLDSLLALGRPAMLVFSNPRCGPCTALLPEVAEWQRAHGSQLTIALVSTGTQAENVQRTERRRGDRLPARRRGAHRRQLQRNTRLSSLRVRCRPVSSGRRRAEADRGLWHVREGFTIRGRTRARRQSSQPCPRLLPFSVATCSARPLRRRIERPSAALRRCQVARLARSRTDLRPTVAGCRPLAFLCSRLWPEHARACSVAR
jgi:hypothetical protein